MYQQGYRPDPFQKKRAPGTGAQAGHTPPSQSSPQGRQPRLHRNDPHYQDQGQPPYQQSPVYMQQSFHPPQHPPSRRQMASPTRRPPRRSGGLGKLLFALFLIAALSAGGYYFYISSQVAAYDTTFAHGIYIDGIDMGGLTAQEGVDLVRSHATERQQSWNVRLAYRGQTVFVITSDMLGMEIKTEEVLNQAWQLGHVGSVFDKKAAQDALRNEKREFYTVVPSANTAVIDDILSDIKDSVYKEAVDARVLGFDPNAAQPFTYQQEVVGRVLDTQPLKERIYERVSLMQSGDIEIEPTEVQPNVFVVDLMAQTALRATWVTVVNKDSTENRTNNIRVAFDKMNGTVLKPGERFSFNGVVGVRTVKNGFFEAIEYAYGTEQMGVGGGVCQASTTLYLAALKAGLEIVKREPHSDSVSYTAYGQDATVSSEKGHEIDFVFKNNTDGSLFITSVVEKDPSNKRQFLSKVSIYGKDMGGVSYKVESQTVEVLKVPDKPVYDKDEEQEHVTYRDETKLKRKGKEGYVVETYLVTIQNNMEVERVRVNRDTYTAKPDRYWVGTKKR